MTGEGISIFTVIIAPSIVHAIRLSSSAITQFHSF